MGLTYYSNTHLSVFRTFLLSFTVIVCLFFIYHVIAVKIHGIENIRKEPKLYPEYDDDDLMNL